MKTFFRSLILLLIFTSCSSEDKKQFDLIIINATIVDVLQDTLNHSQLIAISKDTIRFVDDMSNLDKYEANQTFDAKNGYVLPGLWDMHVHFRGGDTLAQENKNLLPLFLAFGITNIRDAGGDISTSVLEWRNSITNGTLDGPIIYTSGPKLDGPDPAWPGSIKTTSEKEVSLALDSLQTLNVDYVKMYDGSLSEEIFYEIIKQAEERGLKTTGHMPLSADILTATNYGLDGTEHMYYVLKSTSPLGDSLSMTNPSYSMFQEIVDTYNSELALSLYEKLASKNAFITPTLYIGNILSNLTEAEHSNDSLLKYIGIGIQNTYKGRIESAQRAKSTGNNSRSQLGDLAKKNIVPLFNAGVKLLAGSDSGAFNSFVYPGESLHMELEELVNAGLTPQEALTTSIINGPDFFELGQYYGSIGPHKKANLLILENNPLQNIKNLSSIKATVINGKVYSRKKLDSMLKEIKN